MSVFVIHSLYLNVAPAAERRGHEMPAVRHHRPEEGRLRLDLLFDVQDGNLLGHQTSSLGPERTNTHSLTGCWFAHVFERRKMTSSLVLCRAEAIRRAVVDVRSEISLATPTAKTAIDTSTLHNARSTPAATACWKKQRIELMPELLVTCSCFYRYDF